MPFANLSISLSANLSQLQTNLDQAATLSDQATKRIQKSADDAGQALGEASNQADFSGLSKDAQNAAASIDGIKTASMGAGSEVNNLTVQVHKLLDQLSADAKARSEEIGIGTKVAVAAATAGAVYVLYEIGEAFAAAGLRAAEAAVHVAEFGVGLFTGTSLTSKYVDGLIEANKRVLELQSSLAITAASATVLELALARVGTPKEDFTAVYVAADKAIHGNADALNLLGVAYQDANGKLLPTQIVIQNAAKALDTYTAGLERNSAAAALGLGSASQVSAAARLSGKDFDDASKILQSYFLLMGPGSQKAVTDYQEQMRLFRSETDLTAQGLNRAVADAITPTLTEFAEFARTLQGFPDAVGVTREALTGLLAVFEGLELGFKFLKDTADSTWNSLISSTTAAFGSIDKAIHLDFTGVLQEVKTGAKDIGDEFDRLFDKITANRDKALSALDVASGKDSQNAPTQIEQQPAGKTFFGAIDFGNPDKTAAGSNVDVAKKQLEQQLKELELFVSKSKELQTTLDGFFATDYQQGEVSLRDYFDAIGALRDDNLKKTEDSYAKQIAAAEAYIAATRANSSLSQDQIDARVAEGKTKILDIQGKLAKAEFDASVAAIKDADARKAALRSYGDQLSDLEAQIAAFSGDTARAFDINFDKQHRVELAGYRSTLNSPTSTPDDRNKASQGIIDLDQVKQQGNATAKLNDLTTQRSVILGDLANMQARIDLAVSTGAKTELEGLAATSEANRSRLADLQKIVDAYDKIAAASNNPLDRVQADALHVELEKLAAQTDLVADRFRALGESAFESFFEKLLSGTVTLKSAFKSLVADLISQLAKLQAAAAAHQLFAKDGLLGSAISSGTSGGSSSSSGGGGSASILGNALSKLFGSFGSSSGGSPGSAYQSSALADSATYGNTGGFHSGGIVGGEPTFNRVVDMSIFRNARRFHSGGLVDGEVPIIAQKGERVLTKQQQMALMAPARSEGAVNVNQTFVLNSPQSRQSQSQLMDAATRAIDKRRRTRSA